MSSKVGLLWVLMYSSTLAGRCASSASVGSFGCSCCLCSSMVLYPLTEVVSRKSKIGRRTLPPRVWGGRGDRHAGYSGYQACDCHAGKDGGCTPARVGQRR